MSELPFKSWYYGLRQRLHRWTPRRPVILERSGKLSSLNASLTFVVICGPEFDQSVPNAGVTYRQGLSHGFEKLGIPYRFVNVFDLERELADLESPLCFLSGHDYYYLSRSALRILKRLRHFVWVGFWFEGASALYHAYGLPNLSQPDWLNRKILSSEPRFVFTPVTESGQQFYANWQKHGVKLISLPLACDTNIYHRNVPDKPEFSEVMVAFVGGYWPYKARQFDRYLKPYEDRLTVFGYTRWPYAGYGGQISIADEPALVRQARLCPAINEPHAEILGGDICERVYKVLGCGGMCITDGTQAHRDIFDEDELLVPTDMENYHELVNCALSDQDFCHRYRESGYRAVIARHTYAHRARQVLDSMGLLHEIKEGRA